MSGYHIVEQGECLSTIARKYGLPWKKIYDHAQNRKFASERPNPNVLNPGDRIFIPDPEKREEDAQSDRRHSFLARKGPTVLRLVIRHPHGEAATEFPFRLEIGNRVTEGQTDGGGLMETQLLHGDPDHADLYLWRRGDKSDHPCRLRLEIGHLDPVDSIKGVQSRLNNLGFFCGKVDGDAGPRTRQALLEFQDAYSLSGSGEPDQATRQKLLDIHGH